MTESARPAALILIPVYRDWDAVALLLAELSRVLRSCPWRCSVLIVDDCSMTPPVPLIPAGSIFTEINILELRRNLSHQRAIAVGLAYAHEHLPADAIVVMDGDGEDAPADVPRLLERIQANGGESAVFAQRMKRSESWGFRLGYQTYKWLHLMLTGKSIGVGNFSALPAKLVRKVVVLSELWNHYAAAYAKSRLPIEYLPVNRARRLMGRSRMNFTSLVVHGLSALSVQGDHIGVRLLVANLICLGGTTLAILVTIAIRAFTDLAIPGWATTAVGTLLTVMFQILVLTGAFIMLILHGRSSLGFIPLRDYCLFVDRLYPVNPPTAYPRSPSPLSLSPESGGEGANQG